VVEEEKLDEIVESKQEANHAWICGERDIINLFISLFLVQYCFL